MPRFWIRCRRLHGLLGFRNRAEDGIDLEFFSVSQNTDRGALSHWSFGNHAGKLSGILYLSAVKSDDDVACLQSALGGWTVRRDPGDQCAVSIIEG